MRVPHILKDRAAEDVLAGGRLGEAAWKPTDVLVVTDRRS
jgi:hypothetical protein